MAHSVFANVYKVLRTNMVLNNALM